MNEELASSLKKAKSLKPTSALHFVLVMKGGRDGALLMDKTRIPPKAVNDAKKECGGNNVITGRCYGDEEGIVFETTEAPPDTMQVCLDAIIKRETKLSLKSLPRLGAAGPEDAAAQAADAPAGNDPTAPDTSAEKQVAARLKALLPKIQTAVKAGNQEVRDKQVKILQLLQNKEYEQALTEIADLEKTLPQSSGAAPTKEAIKEFQEKLQAFKPLFTKALNQARETDPGWAENLDSNYAQMVQEVKAGNLEAASKTLESLSRMTESSDAAKDEINLRQAEAAQSAVSPSEWKQFTDRFGNLEQLFAGGPVDQQELNTCLTGIQQFANRLSVQLGQSEAFEKFVQEWEPSLEYLYRFSHDTAMDKLNHQSMVEGITSARQQLEEARNNLKRQQRGDLISKEVEEEFGRFDDCLQKLARIYRLVEREIQEDASRQFEEIRGNILQLQTLDPTLKNQIFEQVSGAGDTFTRLFAIATADPTDAVQKVKHLIGLCKEVEKEL